MDVVKTKDLWAFLKEHDPDGVKSCEVKFAPGKLERWLKHKSYPCTCQDEENEYENYKKPGF